MDFIYIYEIPGIWIYFRVINNIFSVYSLCHWMTRCCHINLLLFLKIITSVLIIDMGIHCLYLQYWDIFEVGETGPVNILWKHFFFFRIFFLRFWVALVVSQWSFRPRKNVIDCIRAVKGKSSTVISTDAEKPIVKI